MTLYLVSGREYDVTSADALLEMVKGENAHTRNLPLQQYMDTVAARVINTMTPYNVELPAKADDIVAIWEKIGLIEVKVK